MTKTGPEVAFQQLQPRLDHAYERYLSAGDDGKEGAELACQAVAKYLYDLDEAPERAAVFMALTKHFRDLRAALSRPSSIFM